MVLDIIAMIVVGIVFILLARFRPGSYEGKRYLEWLEDATLSLVCDVDTGRSERPADVTLAAAVAGLGVVRAPEEFVLFPQPREVERVPSYERPSVDYTGMGS